MTYFMVSCIRKILVIIHIHGVFGGAVDNVGHCQPFDHDSMVVAVVVTDEDTVSIFVVRGDKAPGVAETLGRELGDGSFGFRHLFVSVGLAAVE